jgi:hypothetical protein
MAANGHQKTGRSSNPTIYVHMAANDTRSSNPQKKFELNHVRHDDDDVRSIPIRGLKNHKQLTEFKLKKKRVISKFKIHTHTDSRPHK